MERRARNTGMSVKYSFQSQNSFTDDRAVNSIIGNTKKAFAHNKSSNQHKRRIIFIFTVKSK